LDPALLQDLLAGTVAAIPRRDPRPG
jgi:hypothetical protein